MELLNVGDCALKDGEQGVRIMTRWNWLNLVNRVRLVLESAELTPCYELLGDVYSAMQRSGP